MYAFEYELSLSITRVYQTIKSDEQHKQGITIYRQVKGAFVTQGTSLSSWCKDNGTSIANIRHAFYGSWNGEHAEALVKKACDDAGIDYQVAA